MKLFPGHQNIVFWTYPGFVCQNILLFKMGNEEEIEVHAGE